MSERITAVYRLRATADAAHEMAEDVCIEQTVEAHRSLADGPRFRDGILGRVESLVETGPGVHEAAISYPVEVTAFQLPQLMHVLYGNVSLKGGIRLERIDLPPRFVSAFPGPRLGIEGVRRGLGVRERPLIAAALKPMGLGPDEIASRAHGFALGGIDILKDDHGLCDHAFCPFEERVRAVTEAIGRAADRTGRRTLYFPSITERADEILRRADWAASRGADGVLLSPLVTGLDAVRLLASRAEPPMAVMAHPALAGAFTLGPDHGIASNVLMGTLMRLAGADLVIFPSHGGRFPVAREETTRLAAALREPLGALSPAWPVPAGGIDVESVPRLRRDYGDDTVLLVGSSLYTRSTDLASNARRFVELVSQGPAGGPRTG